MGIMQLIGLLQLHRKPMNIEGLHGSWVLPAPRYTGVGVPQAVRALKIKNGPEK